MASQNGHQDVVQSLLGAGADVNTAKSNVSNDILYLWSDANVRELRIHTCIYVHVRTIPSMKCVVYTAIHRCMYLCVCIDEQLDACTCKKYM